jgi:hypothetical protein
VNTIFVRRTPTTGTHKSIMSDLQKGAVKSGGASAAKHSFVLTQPPPMVYQTELGPTGNQDCSTPLHLQLQLGAEALVSMQAAKSCGSSYRKAVSVVIRRFDFKEVEVAVHVGWSGGRRVAAGRDSVVMKGLRLTSMMFDYELQDNGVLNVYVHRKELPVSNCYGGSPFVLIFYFPLVPAEPLVVTNSFVVASKRPPAVRGSKRQPKRIRGPSPRQPLAADAAGVEAEVNRRIMLLTDAVQADRASSCKKRAAPTTSVARKRHVQLATHTARDGNSDDDVGSGKHKDDEANDDICSASTKRHGGVKHEDVDVFSKELIYGLHIIPLVNDADDYRLTLHHDDDDDEFPFGFDGRVAMRTPSHSVPYISLT